MSTRLTVALATFVSLAAALPAAAESDSSEWIASAFRSSTSSSSSTKSSNTRKAKAERAPSSSASSGGWSSNSGGSSVVASYYWQPQQVASGGMFNPNALTAAHKTLPFGTKIQVTNKSNGRSVVVVINDRGPYVAGRSLDLSRRAAEVIGMTGAGVANVSMQVL